MYASWAEWTMLKSHRERVLPQPNLTEVADEVWQEISELCNLPSEVVMDVGYDGQNDETAIIGERSILAYASRTMYVENDYMRSTMFSPYASYYEGIMIRLNPNVPNGWYVSQEGECNTGYRYDMKTVLRHEFLHGIGITSSIRDGYNVGYSLSGGCYPTHFDTLMHDWNGNPVISGCSFVGEHGAPIYVNGVELYHPSEYEGGSSFSHHATAGHLMHSSIPPMTCLELGFKEYKLLQAMGVYCGQEAPPVGVTAEASTNTLSPLLVLLLLLFLFIKKTI